MLKSFAMKEFARCPVAKADSVCYWKRMWKQLNDMRDKSQLCDVTLISDDNLQFKAHSSVLAASSSLFLNYFLRPDSPVYEILLKDTRSDVLLSTLNFIYGITPTTKSEFEQLLQGATQFEINEAVEYCRKHLSELEREAVLLDNQQIGVSTPQPEEAIYLNQLAPSNANVENLQNEIMSSNILHVDVVYSSSTSDDIGVNVPNALDDGRRFSAVEDLSEAQKTLPSMSESFHHSHLATLSFGDLDGPLECPHLKRTLEGIDKRLLFSEIPTNDGSFNEQSTNMEDSPDNGMPLKKRRTLFPGSRQELNMAGSNLDENIPSNGTSSSACSSGAVPHTFEANQNEIKPRLSENLMVSFSREVVPITSQAQPFDGSSRSFQEFNNHHPSNFFDAGVFNQYSVLDQASSYPEQTNPYPVQTSSYPVQTSSFSVQTSSYPVQTSSFSVQTSSYPVQTSSFSVQASSYPVQTSSYPSQQTSSYPRFSKNPQQPNNIYSGGACSFSGNDYYLPNQFHPINLPSGSSNDDIGPQFPRTIEPDPQSSTGWNGNRLRDANGFKLENFAQFQEFQQATSSNIVIPVMNRCDDFHNRDIRILCSLSPSQGVTANSVTLNFPLESNNELNHESGQLLQEAATVLSDSNNDRVFTNTNEQKENKNGKLHPCSDDQCNKCFKTMSQLRAHQKQFHQAKALLDDPAVQHKSGASGKFHCTDCEESFETNYKLQTHQLKVHSKGKLFSCQSCNFKSPRKKDVQAHMLSQHHEMPPGVKIYNCSLCDYKCIDKNRYEEHEAMHTGIERYNCPLCNKAYTTRRGMRTHLKYHSEERPHKCSICGAGFKVRSKLSDHMKLIHVQKGVKPFHCGYCNHSTALRGNCNQHIRKNHPGQPIIVHDQMAAKRKFVKNYDYAGMQGDGIEEDCDIHGTVRKSAVV